MPTRKFENAILLVLSAVIVGGLLATLGQYVQTHPEQVERMLENQRQAELLIP